MIAIIMVNMTLIFAVHVFQCMLHIGKQCNLGTNITESAKRKEVSTKHKYTQKYEANTGLVSIIVLQGVPQRTPKLTLACQSTLLAKCRLAYESVGLGLTFTLPVYSSQTGLSLKYP